MIDSGILLIFLLASFFLLILFAAIIYLPRLFKKKEQIQESVGLNTVMGAFSALGDEIKSLKEQLVLKERLAALGEVSAGIAHEFRNPMGVIAGYARLLLNSLDENDQRRESAHAILKEIGEMNALMEELLKFSKAEQINKKEIDLKRSITDVIDSVAGSERVRFDCDESILISADEKLLKQAIRNILQNGLDSGQDVLVEVIGQGQLGVKGIQDGVYINIKDNGKGIPGDDISKIFMPFYTTKERGTGIGLALAQKIIVAHGGNITVQSKEGQGSTFRLFLPKN